MKTSKAISIAIEATQDYRARNLRVQKQIKTLAFDANLHDRLGNDNPANLTASSKRQELQTAIQILKDITCLTSHNDPDSSISSTPQATTSRSQSHSDSTPPATKSKPNLTP